MRGGVHAHINYEIAIEDYFVSFIFEELAYRIRRREFNC
jgi:hypothetical protein